MKLYAAALDFRAVAREFGVPETFAPEVHADAAAAAGHHGHLALH